MNFYHLLQFLSQTRIFLFRGKHKSSRKKALTIIAEGEIQRSKEGVVHLMATNIIDRTDDLARLSETHSANVGKPKIDEFARPHPPRGSHPRDVRILPKSRDFH